MKYLKNILDFYLNSSIHVALAVCALATITMINYSLGVNYKLLLLLFFATVTAYNFVKYFGLAKFHHRRLATWLKVIQVFSLVCFIGLSYFMFYLSYNTIIWLFSLGLITFFYAIPFLPKHFFIDNKQNLREVSGLKIYIIAIVWSVTTAIIPLIEANEVLTADVFINAIRYFFYVLILMLPFEIRDLQFDSIKLATIPQQIGAKRTKTLGVILVILFYLLLFFLDVLTDKDLLVNFIICVITVLFVMFSKKNQNAYYSAFWVESLPLVWLLLVCLF